VQRLAALADDLVLELGGMEAAERMQWLRGIFGRLDQVAGDDDQWERELSTLSTQLWERVALGRRSATAGRTQQ
jgi:hypothetical protein